MQYLQNITAGKYKSDGSGIEKQPIEMCTHAGGELDSGIKEATFVAIFLNNPIKLYHNTSIFMIDSKGGLMRLQ